MRRQAQPTAPARTLDQLAPGQTGVVTGLRSQGLERRRMMDLGIIPGTHITHAFNSPLHDPIAYQVRGTLVALRQVQAALIDISPHPEEDIE